MGRARRLVRTPRRQIIARAVVGGLIAGLAGALTLAVDRAVPAGALPATLRFPPDNARPLLGALVSAVVTLSAFAFWMRAVMAQLVSSAVSPRIVSVHLYDRFQQTVVGFMAGALVYVAVVLQHVGPGEQSPPFPDVPHLSVTGAVLVALAALVAMIYSMYRSAESLEVGNLVARIGQDLLDRSSALVGAQAHALSAPEPDVELPSAVSATRTGFVRDIDEGAVLEALPEGGAAALEIDVGTFVVAGHTTLVRLPAADGADGRRSERIRSAFTVGPSREITRDLGYGIQQLVDVGEKTLAVGASSASTVYDVLLWLGAVLRTVLDVEPPPRVIAGPSGTCLVRSARLTPADLVSQSFERLRQGGARFPGVAQRLVEILSSLRDDFEGRGRSEVLQALERELRLTVAAAEHSDVPEDEVAALHRMAASDRADDDRGGPGRADDRTGGEQAPVGAPPSFRPLSRG